MTQAFGTDWTGPCPAGDLPRFKRVLSHIQALNAMAFRAYSITVEILGSRVLNSFAWHREVGTKPVSRSVGSEISLSLFPL